MGFLKQGFSGALAAVMVLTSGGLCVGQSVTIHAETKAKTYEDYKKVLNYTAEYQGYEAYKEGLENVKRPETSYEINGADYVTCEGMEPEVLTDYEGMEGTSREFDTLKSKKVPQSLEIGLFFCQIFIFII